MVVADLKATGHHVLAQLLHVLGGLDRQPVCAAGRGHRGGALFVAQQSDVGDAASAVDTVAAGAKVSANVSGI